jgi:predicted transposase/invertase (TIGR01784 family)
MQQSLKKARREGREEGKAKLIKMMIENGSSIEEIAKMTGLAITRINELLENKNAS